MRVYDPRVGRFLSVDPLIEEFPELTPYQFASNNPIEAIDLDGAEAQSSKPVDNNSALLNELTRKLDEMLGGPEKNDRTVTTLRISIKNAAEEVIKYRQLQDMAFKTMLSAGLFTPEFKAAQTLYNEYSGKEKENIRRMEWLVPELYKASRATADVQTYQNFINTQLDLARYSFTAISLVASFIPSGGTSSAFLSQTPRFSLTSSDGFLFGGITLRVPFNVPVQRFGNMSLFRSDFWSLRIGSSKFANRTFNAIKPEWNSLSQFTKGRNTEGD